MKITNTFIVNIKQKLSIYIIKLYTIFVYNNDLFLLLIIYLIRKSIL